MEDEERPRVVSVSRSLEHGPRKEATGSIVLRAGLGVEGDAHLGSTVQHRSRARRDPSQPNLRQVHLIGVELLERLGTQGLAIAAGEMGENVTIRGVDLLDLPAGALLHLGDDAVVELTGLRNPCRQLDGVRPGLMGATLDRDEDGGLVRLAGVMAVVRAEGEVRAGDDIRVAIPAGAGEPLEPV